MIGDLGFGLTLAAAGDAGKRNAALAGVATCILSQIEREYPCADHLLLMGPDDLLLPRERFPIFYGSYDWHSCVHSHWSLLRMLANGCLDERPELARAAAEQLDRSFDADALVREAAFWHDHAPAHEEVPYGATWFLELDAELGRVAARAEAKQEDTEHADTGELARRAGAWRKACEPMRAEMLRGTREWVAGVALPARTGLHSDTAWSLAMAWDWASATGGEASSKADAEGLLGDIASLSRRLYLRDADAPCAYEPSAGTFTSPILNEAALMARVLDASEYETWLQGFLPQVFSDESGTDEGVVAEPLLPGLAGSWDGKSLPGVHEVALPTSRAIAARDAAAPLGEGSTARKRLAEEASRWLAEGVSSVELSGYLADHWVGSFMVAALVDAEG